MMMSNLCPIAASREIMAEDQPKTASEALLSFVKKERLCDVTFTFENSPERIQAHQLCLRSRSPVFDSMFRGRGSVSEMVELRVEDLKPNIFHKFLEFIYSDNLDVTPLEALHLHHLGQKYKVQPLIRQCEALLRGGIPLENAVEMYETAEKYGILDVKQKALDLIVRSLEHLLQDPQLLATKEATLMELLKRNDLRVKEVDLFRFVVRWGQEASTDRAGLPQFLSQLLSELRYTNMTPTEFTTVVIPTKLIPADEAVEIFSYFNGDHSTRAALMNTFKYNTSCRCGKLVEMFNFYVTDESNESHQPKEPLWCEGTTPLLESMCFKVRGLTAMSRTCPRSMYKSHAKLQLKSIQVQWPLLLSIREVDTKPASISVTIFQILRAKNDIKRKFSVSLIDYKVGCALNVQIEPPMDIGDEAVYGIGIADELLFSKPLAPKYRYSSGNAPFVCNLKPNIAGGCLNHVEICQIRRNDCIGAPWNTRDYEHIHVIRGMQLEFTHNNPTD